MVDNQGKYSSDNDWDQYWDLDSTEQFKKKSHSKLRILKTNLEILKQSKRKKESTMKKVKKD